MDKYSDGKNFESQNSNENFLSQSYFDSIQKVTGNDKASLLDFQIPAVLLEKRKNAWNALFEKYSTNSRKPPATLTRGRAGIVPRPNGPLPFDLVCKEEDEMESSEQENEEECTTKNDKRFPMRKPMSMVQYWVNTGNQPYITNNLEKSQSDSGSSLVEECLETVESVNLPCQMINISLEKDLQTDESSSNIYLKLAVHQNEDIEKSLPISIIENKTFRRKKLYNNSESLAEFTPVSEDNTSRPSFKKPIKKCQHPALETPRIASRPSYLVRQQRLKLRTKRKNRISHSIRILHSQKNGKNDNSQNVLQDNSQTINELEENCDENLQNAIDCSQNTKLQEHCERKSNLSNKNLLNNSKKALFNLRPLVVSLKRLPYKYDSMEINSLQEKQLDSVNSNKNDDKIICSQNSSQSLSIRKKSHALQVKSDKLKNLTNGVSPNLTSNSESDTIDCKSSATKSRAFSTQIRNSHSKKSMNYIIVFSSDDESELSISNLRQNSPKLPKETSHIKNSFNVNDCSEKQSGLNSKIDNPNKKSKKSVSNKIKNEKEKHNLKRQSDVVTKLEQSEKNKMTDESCKSLLVENNNKSDSKFFSLSKQMNKKETPMSTNEETATGEPTNSSVLNIFLEESKRNISSGSKSLKENYDQTSSNVLSLNEKRHFSSNEKKTKASETKSKLLKRSIAVKKVRYSGNTSSDEDAHLPLKYDFKSKQVTCADKDNVLKSISTTEETTNLIGDLSANSVLLLKKNENKVNQLAERINKIKMKNQNTLLNSNNDNLKTVKELLPRIDSSEEENYLEDKSSAKNKKMTCSENKRLFKENFELLNDKSRNKGKEKSTKPYLSSKKPKRKSEMFTSSDEECVIPLKIKLT